MHELSGLWIHGEYVGGVEIIIVLVLVVAENHMVLAFDVALDVKNLQVQCGT